MPRPPLTADQRRVLRRKVAALHLPALEKQHAAGNGLALLKAIDLCARAELPSPRWATEAFSQALKRVDDFAVGSLDEAFGHKRPKGKRLSKLRSDKAKGLNVYVEILQAHIGYDDTLKAPVAPQPICPALFEAVGQRHGLSEGTCRKLYYRVRAEQRRAFPKFP